MAKLTGPLHSITATGRLGAGVRYIQTGTLSRAGRNRKPRTAQSLGQRRQSIIIGEAGRLWRTATGRGPEATYQQYVGNTSRAGFFFYTDAVLLEWTVDTLMIF